MRAATVVQVLQDGPGLVLSFIVSFIACFIVVVVPPLAMPAASLLAINRRIMGFQDPLKRSQVPTSNDMDCLAAASNDCFLSNLSTDRKMTHQKYK